MRRMRIGLIAALAAVMVLGVAVAAAAQEDGSGSADVAGRGWLAAKGTGNATLDMGGWIKVRMDGDVAITNLGDDFEVRLRAHDSDEAVTESVGPDVELNDYEGWVAVRGTHFLIEMEGDIAFRAHGHGVAYLEGTGIYKTRRGPVRVWDPAGAEIAIEPAA